MKIRYYKNINGAAMFLPAAITGTLFNIASIADKLILVTKQ